MNKLLSLAVSTLVFFYTQSAHADIEVNFVESAPKDRFVIKNVGECGLEFLIVEIDLTQSAGRLIFDTKATGAGVEVFQPFEVKEGSIDLISSDGVEDGDAKLVLKIGSLLSGKIASFTIDVDDTLITSELGQIRVSGSEIEGGLVRISLEEEKPATAAFDSDGKTTVSLPPCSS